MSKTFSVCESDFAAWFACHLRYLYRSVGVPKSQPSLFKVVGDGTHEACAEEDSEVREAIVAKHVERLPEEQRAEAKVRMEAQIKVADKAEEEEEPLKEQEREKLERWLVPGTNREFVMKSDKIGWGTDDFGREVLQITDLKSGLNPEWLIWRFEMEIALARIELNRREKNLATIKARVSALEVEMNNSEGNAKVAVEKKFNYQSEVLARETAKTEEALVIVKKLAGKLQRTNRKLDRVKTQLFFFAMVAERTRDYHCGSKLAAQFLGEVSAEERVELEKMKAEVRKIWGKTNPEPAANRLEFWYKPEIGREALERYLAILPEMEDSRATKSAEPAAGYHCKGCDYRDSCPAFQAWNESRTNLPLVVLNFGRKAEKKAEGGEVKTA